MRATDIFVVCGIGTVIVAMVAVFFEIKGVRDQLWLHTFAEYTRRYSVEYEAVPGFCEFLEPALLVR